MEQYIVIKLGYMPGVDFLMQHQKIIEENGFVDFARFGKKGLTRDDYSKNYIFIKECKGNGGRLIKAKLGEKILNGSVYPKYYENVMIYGVNWFRVTQMEEISKEEFLKEYVLMNGNEIKALDNGTVPFFYIKKRTDKN
ncbi:hypothetical protein SAMN02910400_01010 [Lachnospiraceae bacterium C10]|nr:hypothetical protein SAMN02910400_01010 [Lachnospiraceae bacterium C10]